METTKLSSKGQIIIPKSLRNARQWRAGQEFFVIDTEDGILLKEKRPFPPSELDDVAGALRYEGQPKTLQDMEQAIEEGIKATWNDST